MDDAMVVLILMQAIAIYNAADKGLIPAIAHLMANGYSQEEAVDALATYDKYVDQVKAGTLGITMH